MNIGTNNIAFNGIYTTSQEGNTKGNLRSFFTNDEEILTKTKEIIQNGKITNPLMKKNGDTVCFFCDVDDRYTVYTRSTEKKTEIDITIKGTQGNNARLSICSVLNPDLTPEALEKVHKPIKDFANTFKEIVTAKLDDAQKAINGRIANLLTQKQAPPPTDDD